MEAVHRPSSSTPATPNRVSKTKISTRTISENESDISDNDYAIAGKEKKRKISQRSPGSYTDTVICENAQDNNAQFIVFLNSKNTNIAKLNPKEVSNDIQEQFKHPYIKKIQPTGNSLKIFCSDQQ